MKILLGIVIYLALGVAVTSGLVWYCDDWDLTSDHDIGGFVFFWIFYAVMILLAVLSWLFSTIFGRLVRKIAGLLPKKG